MEPEAIRAESVRTLYVQARNSVAAAAVVTVYMLVTGEPYTAAPAMFGWLGVQLATQVARFILIAAYRRAAPGPAELPRWAHFYTAYMALAGLTWGATAFVFIDPAQPITLALTLCGLYGISGGSVSGNAYNPPGLYVFAGLIFACVLVRMLMIGDTGHIALGIASACYAGILFLFCRVQAKTVEEGFRIRFENRSLLDELVVQKAEAEEARRRAELANLAKSQFLAAASHDLRQPLYALSLFAASLESLRLDHEGREVVGNIQSSVGALETLFNSLLDVSRLEAGVVEARAEPVAVDELFDRLNQYFSPAAAERGLDLRFRSDGEWVASDPVLLEQVLSNLVSNALRNTPTGGVLVAARRRGAALRFEVWDTGTGIRAADQARIFDDFVQLGNPERDRRKGMGLGLSIARRAVALIEGGIELRSRVGRGTMFAFAQGRTAPPEQVRAPVAAAAQGSLADLSVMIVDDDRDIGAALARLLGGWGVRFEIVPDAARALKRFAAGARYELVLVDYRLGETNGLDLIGAITMRYAGQAPMLSLVTGDLDPAVMAAAQQRGVPLLHKPVNPARLRALMQAAATSRPQASSASAI